ncbi:S1 family peptidase [Nonomuraea rhizosphaerae]|uniref:S1 family peptidase n=1 Tax=Nonomuraea rhizosphaerae TaxID=2665663 RepID=UPI001FE69B9A|nr:S1 family peptidase [Nonomuraea rhizosphaerae]
MPSKRWPLLGATIVAACLATSPLTPAAAASPTPVTPPDSAVVDSIERDFGLTEQQAITRLANEQRAAATESALTASLGASYAGAWLNADASKLTVATTDPNSFRTIEAKGAQPVLVPRSLAQLTAVKDQLDAASAQTGASLWYVDVTTNTVVVVAADQASGEAFAAKAADKAAVRVSVSAEQPQTYINIIGGAAYYIGSSRCSVGFSVTRGGTPGFVSAGHCGRAGSATRTPTGTFVGSSFPGNDYSYITAPGNTATPYVRGSGGANVTVRGSTVAGVGSSICRSGSTTGWRCGTVQQLNATVRYSQGTVTGLTRTNACAEPGDSGGSFISGSQAQGVTSGGSGNCSSGGTTYFQPVNEILGAYGLTLVTG